MIQFSSSMYGAFFEIFLMLEPQWDLNRAASRNISEVKKFAFFGPKKSIEKYLKNKERYALNTE